MERETQVWMAQRARPRYDACTHTVRAIIHPGREQNGVALINRTWEAGRFPLSHTAIPLPYPVCFDFTSFPRTSVYMDCVPCTCV